jgi:hypothetical protein
MVNMFIVDVWIYRRAIFALANPPLQPLGYLSVYMPELKSAPPVASLLNLQFLLVILFIPNLTISVNGNKKPGIVKSFGNFLALECKAKALPWSNFRLTLQISMSS